MDLTMRAISLGPQVPWWTKLPALMIVALVGAGLYSSIDARERCPGPVAAGQVRCADDQPRIDVSTTTRPH